MSAAVADTGSMVIMVKTTVFTVHIHCNECEKKVKIVLKEIEGVLSVTIDATQGMVRVLGSVEPALLIKKLEKKGKCAELWASGGGGQPNNQALRWGDHIINQVTGNN